MIIKSETLSTTDVTSRLKYALHNYIEFPSFFATGSLCDVLRHPMRCINEKFRFSSSDLVSGYVMKHFPDNYSGCQRMPLVLPPRPDISTDELIELANQQYFESGRRFDFKTGSAYNKLRMEVAKHMLHNDLFKVELLLLSNNAGMVSPKTKITILD